MLEFPYIYIYFFLYICIFFYIYIIALAGSSVGHSGAAQWTGESVWTHMDTHLPQIPAPLIIQLRSLLERTHEADTQLSFYRNHEAKSLQKGLCRSMSHPHLEWKYSWTSPEGWGIQQQLAKAFKLLNTAFLGKSALSKLANSKKPKKKIKFFFQAMVLVFPFFQFRLIIITQLLSSSSNYFTKNH